MKKLIVTVAVLGLFFAPMAIATHTAASRSKALGLLAPTPASVAAGGSIMVPKTEISPEYGFMGVFIDTEGNRIGLHSVPQ